VGSKTFVANESFKSKKGFRTEVPSSSVSSVSAVMARRATMWLFERTLSRWQPTRTGHCFSICRMLSVAFLFPSCSEKVTCGRTSSRSLSMRPGRRYTLLRPFSQWLLLRRYIRQTQAGYHKARGKKD
jgi:hypothetical protein